MLSGKAIDGNLACLVTLLVVEMDCARSTGNSEASLNKSCSMIYVRGLPSVEMYVTRLFRYGKDVRTRAAA